MSGTTNTTTQTSGINNPDLNKTISALAKGIQGSYTQGQSITQAPGANTTGGEAAALSASSNPLYATNANAALGSIGNIAAGNDYGTNDPGYAALRTKAINDALQATNSSFNNSGLFGSDSNQRAAGEGVGNAIAGLDYANFQNDQQRQMAALSALPQAFQNTLLPSSVQQSVGASQDAAAQAQANGPTDYLAKLAGIINGTAGAAGTTTSTTQPGTPLWQILLGGGLGAAGLIGGL